MLKDTLPIYIVSSTISILSVLFNAVGLLVLSKAAIKNTNQIFIIKHLSFSNIVVSVVWLLSDVWIELLFTKNKGMIVAASCLLEAVYLTWMLIMFLLTFDRLIGVAFPFKSKVITSSKNVRRTIIIVWIIGTIASIMSISFASDALQKIAFRLWIAFDGLFITIFIITYSVVCFRVLNPRIKGSRSGPKNDKEKLFRMVFYMLLSFILFEVVPDMIFFLFSILDEEERSNAWDPYLSAFYRFTHLTDPLLYVFLQPQAKRTFMSVLKAINCS